MKIFTICKAFLCIVSIKISARSTKRILAVELNWNVFLKLQGKYFTPLQKKTIDVLNPQASII